MRRTHPLPFIFLAALLAPASLAAQDPQPDSSRTCICFDRAPGDLATTFLRANRARIGVYLGQAETVDGWTGVRVVRVEQDGPAEAAGLRDGDVITAVDGSDLGDDPGGALVEAIGALEPGDTVDVTYYRDGNRRTVAVVTDRAEGNARRLARAVQLRDGRLSEVRERLGSANVRVASPRGTIWRLGGHHADLDLVDLNPALGEYFGTDRGVLVSDTDDDALGLEPGDVILSIDGREVRDAAHVRSILASYRHDEPITFAIIRHERATEVTGTVGD